MFNNIQEILQIINNCIAWDIVYAPQMIIICDLLIIVFLTGDQTIHSISHILLRSYFDPYQHV